jgi:YihY family inner membrane protein
VPVLRRDRIADAEAYAKQLNHGHSFQAWLQLALSVIYRFGPSRRAPRWRWITWGSAFATIAWLIASALFSWYVASLGSYNKTYGSLGAIIGFMTWMWVSIIVVLVGAKLNAEIVGISEQEHLVTSST